MTETDRIFLRPDTIIAPVWWLRSIGYETRDEYEGNVFLEVRCENVMKAIINMTD